MDGGIEEFRLCAPQSALVGLRGRLTRTRWPERETVDGRAQGVPLAAARLKAVVVGTARCGEASDQS